MKAKSKVLILGDSQGWIVDRIIAEMVKRMPFDFTVESYTKINSYELVALANSSDLTHYGNWDLSYHLNVLGQIKKPFLFSIRSHRYPDYVPVMANRFHTHVINPMLLKEFPNATYIPDAVFDEFRPDHRFTVGMAFQEQSRTYKGYELVRQACIDLGCDLEVATNLSPSEMLDFYKRVDLVVVASIAEGHNTIAMECAMMNKPCITTNVGIPATLNLHKCDRTVDSIRDAIGRFYTYPQVKDFTWDNVCRQFTNLYESLICTN